MLFSPRKWIEPHLQDALDAMRFELKALKTRWLGSRRLETLGCEYLQLGSGTALIKGFLNTDLTRRPGVAGIDTRFPLPFDDNTWLGIYSHHVVEHLSYPDARRLFQQAFRVLRPGGIFRMAVPDLEVFIKCYSARDQNERTRIFKLLPDWFMSEINARTPLEMVDYMFRDTKFNRHLSAWDWETAKLRLSEAGFSKIIRQPVNVSLDPGLAGHDKPHWAPFSLYVEAVK